MANDRKKASDDWMNEPLMGYREDQLGVLGLPLPKPPDHFATVMALLSAGPKIVPEPQTMARAVAAQGRGDDSEIAHLTPGEVVIPKRLQTPDVLAALKQAAGGRIERYTVGHPANRVNPYTGAPEFDDDNVGDEAGEPIAPIPAADEGGDLTPDTGYAPVADGGNALQGPADLQPFPKLPYYLPAAEAVYGETASLRPQLIDPAKGSQDPSNWDPASAANLAKGRADIAGVYQRNQRMKRLQPTDFMNPIQMRQWDSALQAAAQGPQADQALDPRINRLFMFQEGLSKSPEHDKVLAPIGPFRKRGAGDVINGDNAYIDLYPQPAPKRR